MPMNGNNLTDKINVGQTALHEDKNGYEVPLEIVEVEEHFVKYEVKNFASDLGVYTCVRSAENADPIVELFEEQN